MSEFILEIVTPERKFFEGNVEMIVVKGLNGDIGIMGQHEPYITPLAIGRIKIQLNKKFRYAALSQGYVEVSEEKTTILADTAEWAEEIDVERAERAKIKAEKLLNENPDEMNLLRAELSLKKALTRLGVAKNM